ncbi:DUF819 family protein [bacterium]|nr:DUF819 family protein [bacterium]
MSETALILPQDSLSLWTLIVLAAAAAIWLEQSYRWGTRVSGPVLALLGGLLLSNTHVIPTRSPVYDTVWDYVVPLSIPLLLFKCDIRKIWKETGRLLGLFHLSALGTIAGGLAAGLVFSRSVESIAAVSGIMTASYIGGSINFLACVSIFRPPENISNALIVADNLVMAMYILVLLALPGLTWAMRAFGSLPETELREEGQTGEQAQDFWRARPVSLLDIARNLALAFFIVTLATKISQAVAASGIGEPLLTLLGNRFLLYTTLTVLFVLAFPRLSENLRGTQELGTFAIYLFFVLIGVPASVRGILTEAPLLLVVCALMIAVNMAVTFGLGRLFGFKLQEMILASIANIGGPMNSAAVAISRNWPRLIIPAFLIGVWGYVIGTYCGVAVGRLLEALLH